MRKIKFLKFDFTSASHDVEKDPAIVDHSFAEVVLILNLFVHTNES